MFCCVEKGGIGLQRVLNRLIGEESHFEIHLFFSFVWMSKYHVLHILISLIYHCYQLLP